MPESAAQPSVATPVFVLTGFLGSGKTTLLSRLIHCADFSDTAVIINEFGEVGLDHLLLGRAAEDDILLLDSGCICCAMNNSLQEALESLFYRRLRGELPAFSRVVVETSGLADPAPLINTLLADRSIARHYRLGGVLATVDVIHGPDALNNYREAATQVAMADRIVLTKSDLVAPQEVAAVRALVVSRNPVAEVIVADRADSAADAAILRGLEHRQTGAIGPGIAKGGMQRFSHLLRYGISSFVLRVSGPVSWDNYAAWVGAMQQEFGARVLRVKGILPMSDGQNYAIHGVHHLFSPPQLLDSVPESHLGMIVIIARDTDDAEVRASFRILENQLEIPS